MNVLIASPVTVAAGASLALLSIAGCVCFFRLMIGPSLPDRVIALDMIGTLLIGMFVLAGILGADPETLSVATVLALLNFLATVAFAIYVNRKAAP